MNYDEKTNELCRIILQRLVEADPALRLEALNYALCNKTAVRFEWNEAEQRIDAIPTSSSDSPTTEIPPTTK